MYFIDIKSIMKIETYKIILKTLSSITIGWISNLSLSRTKYFRLTIQSALTRNPLALNLNLKHRLSFLCMTQWNFFFFQLFNFLYPIFVIP